MPIRPVKEDLLHADEQTDMAKLIDSFCNFANPPKMLLKGVKAHSRLTTFPACRNSTNYLAEKKL